jgi:triacylglycerol lipase
MLDSRTTFNSLEAVHLAQQCYTDQPTFGKVGESGRAVAYGSTIAFPGTDNIACWLADLDVYTVAVSGLGVVHKGFWNAWQEVSSNVMKQSSIDVVLGHSEGAALALLCAASLCLVGRAPKQVFAFEPPRISIDATIGLLLIDHAVEIHLYRNGEDVVPIVPRGIDTWQHPGILSLIGKARYPFPNVDDHYIVSVVNSITELEALPVGS